MPELSGLQNVLGSLADTSGKVIPGILKERRDRENKLKDIQAQGLLDQIHATGPDGNPILSDTEREAAWDEIGKIYSGHKSSKDIIQRARDLSGKVFGFMKAPPHVQKQAVEQMGQLVHQVGSEAPTTTAGGPSDLPAASTPAAMLQPPPSASVSSGMSADGGVPEVPKTPTTTPAQEAAISIPPPPTQAQPTSPHPPTPQPTSATPPTRTSLLARGVPKLGEVAKYQTEQNITHSNAMELAKLQGEIANSNQDARIKAEHVSKLSEIAETVRLRNMKMSSRNVQQPDGTFHKIVDVQNPTTGELVDTVDLGEVARSAASYKTGWIKNDAGKIVSVRLDPTTNQPIPGTENDRAVPPAGLLPTFSTHEIVTVDPVSGQVTVTQLQSTSQKGGVGGVGNVLQPPPNSGGAGGAGGAGGRNIGMPVGLYAQNVAREIPLREAYTQILGSPDHPDLGSLKDFAAIADDPVRRTRLNAAVKATFDPIELQEKTHGGILNYISLVGGLPQAINQAQSGANAEIIQKNLGDDQELQHAYNSIMTAYSNIVGLRAFTKASAAEFSVKQIENELAIPGGNSFSSKDYYDKMAKLALNLENVSRKTPTMSPEERKYITDQVDNLVRLSKGTAIKPPPGAATAPKAKWTVIR